ncbi:hypothetical protein HKB32_00310, partial [Vibrio parahaemolyticus]
MYLDKKVQQVLEQLIVDDERFESYVLNGDSIDVAKLKERQSKRNEIVELISRLPVSKTARSVDTEFLEGLLTEKGKYDLKQIGKENKKTTYKALLGK